MPDPDDHPQEKQNLEKPSKEGEPSPTEETTHEVEEPTGSLVPSHLEVLDSKEAGIYLRGESSSINEDSLADGGYRHKFGVPRWHRVGRRTLYTKEAIDAYLATRNTGE